MKDLTEKQKQFFDLLKSHWGKDALGSFEEIRKLAGFSSKNSVTQYVNVLKNLNLLEMRSGRLYIAENASGAPFFESRLRAGFASAMDDAVDRFMSFDRELNINNPETFIFKVAGDSMVELGIFEGDYVSIKKCSEAADGDIVLANVDGGFTLKTYRKRGGRVWLQPANSAYPNIYPEQSLVIFGIATGIVRKL